MRRLLRIAGCLAASLAAPSLSAQDLIGFDRANFGKVVLSGNQSAGVELELSIGSYNNESIRNYSTDSVFATMGRSVGRLDILTDAGVFPCTAFIVDEKHVLTNYHCVPGILEEDRANATRIDAVQFVAGYTQQGVEEGTKTYFVSPTPVEANKELDYAVLEVIGNPSATYGKLALASRQPRGGDPYWVIGHPMGEAQRISREKCRANKPALSNNRLLHTCDTLPGNSGSPVIDASLQSVVGLHHAGSKKDSVNFAIPMSLILQRSTVLIAAQSGPPRNPGGNPAGPRPGAPKPGNTADESGGPDSCDGLYAEAKRYDACFAYQAYADQCKTHLFVGFARGYIGANCGGTNGTQTGNTQTVDPTPPTQLLRPWCGASRLNPTERTICGDAYLAQLDKEMGQAYDRLGSRKDPRAQKAWLQGERDTCGSNRTCIINAVSNRIRVLEGSAATATPGNYKLPEWQCYIVVASRPSVAEVKQFIANRLTDRSNVRVFKSDNGYYGISVAVVNRSDAPGLLQQWKSQYRIPSDSYCSSGRRFIEEVALSGNSAPPAQQGGGTWYVDNNNDGGLNLRAGPSTSYSIILEMEVGLQVAELSRQNGWYKLRLPNGTQGWASGKYLVRAKPWVRKCSGRVVGLGPLWTYNASTGDGFLAVRSKPSASTGRLIAEVYQGDTVRVVAQRNGWARLQCVSGQCKTPYRGSSDAIGWASKNYLSIQCN